MTLGHPFFQFFHSEIANPKCKKVFLYGENRHFRLGAFNFPLHFVRLLPKSSSPSALQADAFGELTPKKIGPFFPHQLIQKMSNFSSNSLKISQNPQKSRGFSHTKQRQSKITIALVTVDKDQMNDSPADGAEPTTFHSEGKWSAIGTLRLITINGLVY